MNYLVHVEYPHDWNDGFTLSRPTLDAARNTANEYARGKWGESGYRRVIIYSLVEEVN